jgi:predicted cobalt transporter CbtA
MDKEIIVFGIWTLALLGATHRCLKKAVGNPATIRTLVLVGALLTAGFLVVLKQESSHLWALLGAMIGFSLQRPVNSQVQQDQSKTINQEPK